MNHTIHNPEMTSVYEIQNHVRKKIGECHADEKKLLKIDLLLEELIVNIIKYGLSGVENGLIRVSVDLKGHCLLLEISDNGIAFNPLDQKAPDLSINIKDRKPGGFGIFIVKQISRSMEYVRQSNMNIIRLAIDL